MNAAIKPLMKESPLKEQVRLLPLEFDYPYVYEINCNIKIPDGYVVDDIPENIKMGVCDNGAEYIYMSQSIGDRITVRLVFRLNRILFSQDEYSDLQTFYGMVVDHSNSQIVLKKAE